MGVVAEAVGAARLETISPCHVPSAITRRRIVGERTSTSTQ
jgi:hypothetical protein